MNNLTAKQTILQMLDRHHVTYGLLHHSPARTSQESAAARAGSGFPNAMGAKALIVKLYWQNSPRQNETEYATLVVPSSYQLDARSVRHNIDGLKKFRFLTPEEMHDIVQLSPGCMPPFGPGVFDKVAALYVDTRLEQFEQVGFNVADVECSIVLATADYLKVAVPTRIVTLSIDSPEPNKD